MKNIAILGSTGSIGQNALEVIRHFPERFRAIALTAHTNIDILQRQIEEFRPLFVCVSDKAAANKLKSKIKSGVKLFAGEEGLGALAQESKINKVLLAISGAAALYPLLKAIESGKEIALANKEALVMAGPLLMERAARKKIKIIPVDSEQSAIWQCLSGEDPLRLKTIYLTASGGPFRQNQKRELKNISLKKVLRHPTWKMGRKITVDSATLMNKGLEVIETMFLFAVSSGRVKILIHPESIVHSLVQFVDGVVLAQLSAADMRIPIQYALSYPERISNSLPTLDFYKLRSLNFQEPDFKKFPCLGLAYQAARELGTMPAVLNASNEISVNEFLQERLKFISIPRVIEKVLRRHRNKKSPDLSDIREADAWARSESFAVIDKLNQR